MAGKKIKLDTEAIGEFLVADTNSESCSEASDFEEYFEEEEEKVQQQQQQQQQQQEQQQQQQASADIETGCDKWWITNLGTTSRKEHKYSSFCPSSKRFEKN
jgi:membrane protease subunit (stomatin/prohibitin family)